jgi:hypothetical protein
MILREKFKRYVLNIILGASLTFFILLALALSLSDLHYCFHQGFGSYDCLLVTLESHDQFSGSSCFIDIDPGFDPIDPIVAYFIPPTPSDLTPEVIEESPVDDMPMDFTPQVDDNFSDSGVSMLSIIILCAGLSFGAFMLYSMYDPTALDSANSLIDNIVHNYHDLAGQLGFQYPVNNYQTGHRPSFTHVNMPDFSLGDAANSSPTLQEVPTDRGGKRRHVHFPAGETTIIHDTASSILGPSLLNTGSDGSNSSRLTTEFAIKACEHMNNALITCNTPVSSQEAQDLSAQCSELLSSQFNSGSDPDHD